MSAYVVHREHIIYLVEAGFRIPGQHSHLYWIWDIDHEAGSHKSGHLRPGDYNEAQRVGQMLWDENVKSVLHRYPDCTSENAPGASDPDHLFVWPVAGYPPEITPIQVLAAMNCYVYQSCEHPGWHVSEAKAYVEALRDWAITRLPGYDQTRSEITRRITLAEARGATRFATT